MTSLEILLRLLTALALGGLIGYERQARSKAAGLRTHILVSMGACLYMMVSLTIPLEMQRMLGITSDGGRIAAQVVSGIGFLGAGSILSAKGGHRIFGLTTAASIWAVAAVGLAAGAGLHFMAAATTFLILITLKAMYHVDAYLEKRRADHKEEILLTVDSAEFSRDTFRAYLMQQDLGLSAFREDAHDAECPHISVVFSSDQMVDPDVITRDLMTLPGVRAVEIVENGK